MTNERGMSAKSLETGKLGALSSDKHVRSLGLRACLIAVFLTVAAACNSGSTGANTVVCDFYDKADDLLVEAATQAFTQGNEATSVRSAITEIRAIADRAAGTEQKDLTNLADVLESTALSGGGFVEWDPAYEAFHAKYGPACGEVVLTPAP